MWQGDKKPDPTNWCELMCNGAVIVWSDESEEEGIEGDVFAGDDGPRQVSVPSATVSGVGAASASVSAAKSGSGRGEMKMFLKHGDQTKKIKCDSAPSREEVLSMFREKFSFAKGAVPYELLVVRGM